MKKLSNHMKEVYTSLSTTKFFMMDVLYFCMSETGCFYVFTSVSEMNSISNVQNMGKKFTLFQFFRIISNLLCCMQNTG